MLSFAIGRPTPLENRLISYIQKHIVLTKPPGEQQPVTVSVGVHLGGVRLHMVMGVRAACQACQ